MRTRKSSRQAAQHAGLEDLDDGRVCLIVTGPPGSGKSSISRLVAQRLRRDRYGLLALAMVAGVGIVAVVHSQMEFVHWFLAIEISLLGLFFLF